jgi:hypothetical protein
MADHRQDYTPAKLYMNGRRMTDGYTADDAVAEYMRMHPEANRDQVRDEVEKVAA